jgi:hypothetical protein
MCHISVPPMMCRVSLFCFRSALVAVTMAVMAGGSVAEENGVRVANPRDYAIPAQPLATALKAYIKTSGVQVLYETLLTEGRRSRDVVGRFTPKRALEILLSGTGLAAQRADVDAFVIMPSPSGRVGPTASTARPDPRFMAALQTAVVEALCRAPLTRPGGYKIAVELWIGPSGAIQRSALIGSTGDAERDKMLLAVLQDAPVRMPPPAGFQQPFIFTIGQRAPQETGDCSG